MDEEMENKQTQSKYHISLQSADFYNHEIIKIQFPYLINNAGTTKNITFSFMIVSGSKHK